jgi:hypothetical protein
MFSSPVGVPIIYTFHNYQKNQNYKQRDGGAAILSCGYQAVIL